MTAAIERVQGGELQPVDVNAWIGEYPFRDVPHPTPDVLIRVLEREGFSGAWVGHLPGAFHRDPVPSNRHLYAALRPYRRQLAPAPMVRPDWPKWEHQLRDAVDEGAPAIRVYPAQWGLPVQHPGLIELADACGETGVAMLVTVRFEDLRQRHPLDTAGDVSAAMLRAIARRTGAVRAGRGAVMLVVGAGKDLIEETHWGLTPDEQSRVFYDFHWIWGPPEDHFGQLVRTVGAQHLTLSSWWPLRLTQQCRALLALLPDDLSSRASAPDFHDGRSLVALARRHVDSPPVALKERGTDRVYGR